MTWGRLVKWTSDLSTCWPLQHEKQEQNNRMRYDKLWLYDHSDSCHSRVSAVALNINQILNLWRWRSLSKLNWISQQRWMSSHYCLYPLPVCLMFSTFCTSSTDLTAKISRLQKPSGNPNLLCRICSSELSQFILRVWNWIYALHPQLGLIISAGLTGEINKEVDA